MKTYLHPVAFQLISHWRWLNIKRWLNISIDNMVSSAIWKKHARVSFQKLSKLHESEGR